MVLSGNYFTCDAMDDDDDDEDFFLFCFANFKKSVNEKFIA